VTESEDVGGALDLDAFMRAFDVLVLQDCVATFAEERDLHDAALRNLSLLFAVLGDFIVLQRAVPA
jgi:isochorismate hydrolase